MAFRRTRTVSRRRPFTPRRSNRRYARPWTHEEIAFMRKFYRNYETAWIARQLGRTVYSVRYKAVDLNIKKANPSIWRGNTGNTKAFNTFSRPRSGRYPRQPRKSRPRRTPRTRYTKGTRRPTKRW
jgi:hypothetical protein